MSRYGAARLGGLLAAALVSLTSCSSGTGTTAADAPRSIQTPGVTDDTELRIVSEYGIVHRAHVRDGHIETPLLWDGTWTIEGGRDTTYLHIGDPRYSSELPENPAAALLSCWTDTQVFQTDGETQPPAVTPEGVRCTQTLLLRLAADDGYTAAASAIEEVRREVGDDPNLWSWYCGLAGEAAAAGAVLGGADGRSLIREEESFCDYSVLHGVGAMTATLAGADAVAALSAVCATDSGSKLPAIARTSQCWHGGGMGIIRTTRLDLDEGGRLCLEAPEESSQLNCLEGIFSFMRTYQLRGATVMETWPELDVDFATCAAIGGDPRIVETCYRSVALSTVRELATTVLDSHDVRARAVASMRDACPVAPGTRTESCWTGLGTLLALALHPDVDERVEVERWVAVCGEAPDHRSSASCYERALLGLLRNDQLTTGLEIDELLPLAPPELRDDLRGKLDNWAASIGGRSN